MGEVVRGLQTARSAAQQPVTQEMEAVAWERTGVGLRSQWPTALETMVRVVVGSRFSMWMAWGPQLTFFCNDAYAHDTLGVKYPWALGQPASAVWAEIWPDIGPRIEHVLQTGEATWDENLLLFLERSGYREETYHTFSYSPLFDHGAVSGMLCVVTEGTERVVGERRMATLRSVAADFGAALSEDDVARALRSNLESSRADLPFALVFVRVGEGWQLLAASGLDGLDEYELRDITDGARWLDEPMLSAELRVLEDLGTRFLAVPRGRWDSVPTSAMVLGLSEAGQGEVNALLVAGLSPLRPVDDSYSGFVTLLARQTESALSNVRAFRRERERAESLAELDRAKTTFFTNISHEFRTPLTLMLGPLEEVLGNSAQLEADHRSRLDVVHRNGLRLLKLVNALLEFARIEGGHVAASMQPVDIVELTTELVGMFRSAVEDAGLGLSIEGRVPRPVLVDPGMWELIITNLLSNAFKHTFDGAITVTIVGDDEAVRLRVADTGTGIPAAELPHLFARFHRVEGAASRSHEGSGVGLSLVHDLVDLHGGSIDVSSELGRGTTFTVSIPARYVDSPVESAVVRTRTLEAQLGEMGQWARLTEVQGGSMDDAAAEGSATILVADDNADMRAFLGRMLSDRYHVVLAVDGADALAKLRGHLRPDLIITDVMMPNIDGFELVRQLRADPALTDVPVIVLSARAGQDASVESLELGADDYLVKPFSGRDLLARVAARLATAIERRRAHLAAKLSESLHQAADHRAVVEACHRCAQELLGHDQTLLAVIGEDRLSVLFSPPVGVGLSHRYASVALDSTNPLARVATDGDDRWIGSVEEFSAMHPELAADFELSGMRSIVISPITDSTDRRIGALAVGWHHEKADDAVLLGHLHTVCAVTGRALERLAAIDDERRVATAIQQQLLDVRPRSRVASFATRYRPGDASLIVGGDWYDAFDVNPTTMGLVVGDVVGHGLPAAIAMSQLRSSLATTLTVAGTPSEAVAMADGFARRVPGALATTALVASIEADGEQHVLRWCAAGHPPPIISDAGQTRLVWEGRRPPLGISPVGPVSDGWCALAPGSLIVLYTDGLVERRTEPLDVSLERLRTLVEANRRLPVHLLYDRLIEVADPARSDDVVLLAARVAGSSADTFVDVFAADPGEQGPHRGRLRGWLRRLGVDSDIGTDIVLALQEAVANAIDHGSDTACEVVTVEVGFDAHRLVATVSDSGSWSADSASSVHANRGRGLAIMERLARVGVDRSRLGTVVTLAFDEVRSGSG